MFNSLIFLAFLCGEQPPSGGCVLKQIIDVTKLPFEQAAAFGRLCVETLRFCLMPNTMPSSRLRAAVCWNVLSMFILYPELCSRLRAAVCWNYLMGCHRKFYGMQPPSGGCVLKLITESGKRSLIRQPPSGGCVLKQQTSVYTWVIRCSRLRAAVCWNS